MRHRSSTGPSRRVGRSLRARLAGTAAGWRRGSTADGDEETSIRICGRSVQRPVDASNPDGKIGSGSLNSGYLLLDLTQTPRRLVPEAVFNSAALRPST